MIEDTNANALIGMSLEKAQGIANVRVLCEDGVNHAGSMEYRPLRINVEVSKGIIIKIICIG